MRALGDSEKLKTARKIVEFANRATSTTIDITTYQTFIASNEQRVIETREALWNSPKPPEHWSTLKIQDRAEKLGEPFDELYEINYRHLSWHVHAGLTGVFWIGTDRFCYRDPHIFAKLDLARLAPASSDASELAGLQHELFARTLTDVTKWW